VYTWQKQHQEQGEEGLKSKEVPGRPSKLNERQRKKLVEILLQGAVKSGYTTDLWTTARIGEVIKQRLKVEYHPKYVWNLLTDMGWSCQKPEKVAREKNEQEVGNWKKYRWPHIKKRPEKEGSSGIS
jgi:transposase